MPPVARAEQSEDGEPEDTPEGWAQLWSMELDAARTELKKWQRRARKIDKRFRDEREEEQREDTRWNIFTANVRLQRSALYGKTPQVDVSRRFADAKDDASRVAGELMERLLNTDIERDGDGYALAIQCATDDYLLPGLGNAWARYVLEEEEVPETPAKRGPGGEELAPAVPARMERIREDVEVDYVHWADQLWSPARVWQEVRWWARKAEMSRRQLVQRFGALGRKVPLNAPKGRRAESSRSREGKPNIWSRAEVWEIWSKEHKRVFWYVEGLGKILDTKEDPLKLLGFWPFPRPLMANVTTSAYVPVPDFVVAQDLYNEIDVVSTKISELQDALKVAGVYDGKEEGLQALLEHGGRNVLIPMKNWGRFVEGGGMKGAIDWLPIEQIAVAMEKLRAYRAELIQALDQIEGTSDLMRGQGAQVEETARATGIKARFGSIRLQAKQDEVARFASELQWIKAQIICRFFEPETILERSNAAYLFDDPALAQEAVALLKDKLRDYRVAVKPENVSLQDFAALKQESLEVLAGIASFLQNVAPLAQQLPGSLPFLLEILQWAISRLRGASTVETVLDRAITQAKQAAAAPQQQTQAPDPKVIAAQLKMQGDQQRAQLDMQKGQAELQRDLVRTRAQVDAEAETQRIQTEENIREETARAAIKQAARPVPVVRAGADAPGGVP